MTKSCSPITKATFIFILTITSNQAYSLDTDPGSYAQFPDGSIALQALGQYRSSTNLNLSSKLTPPAMIGDINRSRLQTEISAYHFTGYYDVDGVMIDPHIFMFYNSINHVRIANKTQLGSTGCGDPILAVVISPIHTPDNSKMLGLGLAVLPPMGQYTKGKVFNVGGNRWQGIVQMDGIYEFVPHWKVVGSVDANFYADNPDAGTGHQRLTQDTTYQVQPWLKYNILANLSGAIGYSQIYGGRQYLNGVMDGVMTNARQIRLDFNYAPINFVFIGLQLGRDITVEGGYRESGRITGRATYVF